MPNGDGGGLGKAGQQAEPSATRSPTLLLTSRRGTVDDHSSPQ